MTTSQALNDDATANLPPLPDQTLSARQLFKIDTDLEDLAGNNMRRLFDVMPGDSAARGAEGAVVRIPFTPRAAQRSLDRQ